MKGRVGILTMPVKENYGGIIQAAALYHFLEKEGWQPFLIKKKYDESPAKAILRYILSNNPLYKLYDYKNLTKREKRALELNRFINKFFVNKTKNTYNRKQFVKQASKFPTIIVGSDQVWRYKYVNKDYRYYFLDYLPPTTKKISYAASFGVDIWEGPTPTKDVVTELLRGFYAVSVREDSGVIICNNTFNIPNVHHVLDPTFLPGLDFYERIINEENLTKKVELFTYVLDKGNHVSQTLRYLSDRLKMEVSSIELTNFQNSNNPSIGEWLYYFRTASFVFTDSFHGVVFCILFEKQFVCLANKTRGYTRFESLLRMFDLQNRIVFDYDSSKLEKMLSDPIDYTKIRETKNRYVELSKEFLINNLNDS